MHLHDPDGRAPGLKAALDAGKHRRLQIAFPMDRGFIQQSFTRWSASALEIYGNAGGLYLIDVRVSPTTASDPYAKVHYGVANRAPLLRPVA